MCSVALEGGRGPCPYHAMLLQRTWVAAAFSRDIEDLHFIPVFPDYFGDVVKKTSVVSTVQAVATLTGMGADKVKGVTGHVCRITGSQHLAMLGFDIALIQLMARWSSDIVQHYIAEAPLGSVTEKYKQLAAGRSLEAVLTGLVTEVAGLRGRLDAMVVPTADMIDSERTLMQVRSRACDEHLGFIENTASAKVHRPVMFLDDGSPTKTRWGWVVEPRSYACVPHLPELIDPVLLCGVCMPQHRHSAMEKRSALDRQWLKWETKELHDGVSNSSSCSSSASSESSS